MGRRHFVVNIDSCTEEASARENCYPQQTGCQRIERFEEESPEMQVPKTALPGREHRILENGSFHGRAA